MSPEQNWTEDDWANLFAVVQENVAIPDEQIRAIAESYMEHGPDGGGNEDGLLGTFVAMKVDLLNRARVVR